MSKAKTRQKTYFFYDTQPQGKLHERYMDWAKLPDVEHVLSFKGSFMDYGLPALSSFWTTKLLYLGGISELNWGAGTTFASLNCSHLSSIPRMMDVIKKRISTKSIFLNGLQPAFIMYAYSVFTNELVIAVRAGSGEFGIKHRNELRREIGTEITKGVDAFSDLGERILKTNDDLLRYASVNRQILIQYAIIALEESDLLKPVKNRPVTMQDFPHNYIEKVDGFFSHHSGTTNSEGFMFGGQGGASYHIFRSDGDVQQRSVPAWSGLLNDHIGNAPTDALGKPHTGVHIDVGRMHPLFAPQAIIPPTDSLLANSLDGNILETFVPLGIITKL